MEPRFASAGWSADVGSDTQLTMVLQRGSLWFLVGLACSSLPACGDGSAKSSNTDGGGGTGPDAAPAIQNDSGQGANGSSKDDAGGEDAPEGGGPALDAGGSECDADVSKADQALIDGLEKAMQLWRWSKEKNGDELTDFTDPCDGTLAYRVGPEVFPKGTARDYATCVVASKGFVELSSGRLGDASSCPDLSCTPKLGVIWNTATSGSVFALDAVTGKPTGLAQFYLVLYGVDGDPYPHLVWSGNGGGSTGYLMDAQLGSTAVLQCP